MQQSNGKITMKKLLLLLIAVCFMACSDKPHKSMFIELDNVPPNNIHMTFNNYTDLYWYFRKLPSEQQTEMIRRLKDNHPVVDSLKDLVAEWHTQDSLDRVRLQPTPTTITITGPSEIILDKDEVKKK